MIIHQYDQQRAVVVAAHQFHLQVTCRCIAKGEQKTLLDCWDNPRWEHLEPNMREQQPSKPPLPSHTHTPGPAAECQQAENHESCLVSGRKSMKVKEYRSRSWCQCQCQCVCVCVKELTSPPKLNARHGAPLPKKKSKTRLGWKLLRWLIRINKSVIQHRGINVVAPINTLFTRVGILS